MSMLPDPSLEGFLERTIQMEIECTVSEWASIAAGLLLIMKTMKEQEATRGPMPEKVQKHYDILSEFVQMINLRLKVEEAEYRGTDASL